MPAELAQRVRRAERPADTIARLGGDEFVVVCEQLDDRSALMGGRRLEDAISGPLIAGGVEHQLSARIGVALGRSDAEALLRDADAAVYRAKAHGRGQIELFA